jgi:NO-binding membrane sensor protein with MHYT domain
MSATSVAEYAVVLWIVTAGVALLTAHVGLGWLARARRKPDLTLSWPSQLLSAATLGTGVCATAVLGLSVAGLGFPMGYGAVAAPVLWLGAVIACLPVVAVLTRRASALAVLFGALLLAAMVGGVQMGWVWAAGFRPGVLWKLPVVGAAAAAMAVGFVAALWMAVNKPGATGHTPGRLLRLGSSTLLGLSLLVGQQMVLSAADLGSQKGSVYRNQVPNSLLSLGCGVLVPLTLVIMALDLSWRRGRRHGQQSGFTPQKRRKRRHRVRTL